MSGEPEIEWRLSTSSCCQLPYLSASCNPALSHPGPVLCPPHLMCAIPYPLPAHVHHAF